MTQKTLNHVKIKPADALAMPSPCDCPLIFKGLDDDGDQKPGQTTHAEGCLISMSAPDGHMPREKGLKHCKEAFLGECPVKY